MKSNSLQVKSKQKINTNFEENNDLFFNMSKQHHKIHANNQHQEQLFKEQSESSMKDSQSINNVDKTMIEQKAQNQTNTMNNESHIIQQLKVFSPNQIIFDQSFSSRSFNLQNNNDLSQTNSSLVKNYKHPHLFLQTLQMSQFQANQQKLRNSQSNFNEQPSTQQNLNKNSQNFLQIQNNYKDALQNNFINLVQNNNIIEDNQSDTIIRQIKQIKRKNFIQKMFTSNKNKQDQIHNIRFEKGIQIIKNILPIQGQESFKIKQKVKQFIEQLKLYFPNRKTDILSEDIFKLIQDKSTSDIIFLLLYKNSEKMKNLNDIITVGQNFKHIYRLVNQLLNVFLIAHIVAICLYVMYLIEEHQQIYDNWVQQAKLQDRNFYEKYIYSLYWSEQSCKTLSELTQDSMFGEISFFSGLPRTASARSLKTSTIYKINRQAFINLLKNYEEDFERYKMIQELIISQQNYKCLYSQCFSCRQLGHSAINCQKAHLNIDKQFVILKNNFSIFQDRQNFIKSKKKYKSSNFKQFVLINKQICEQLKINCQNYNSYTQLLYKSDKEVNNLSYEDTDNEKSSESDQSSQESNKEKQLNNTLTNIKQSLIYINDFNNQLISQSVNQLINDKENNIDQNQIMINFQQEGLQNKNHVNSNDQLNFDMIEDICKSNNLMNETDQIKNNQIHSFQNRINLHNISYINNDQHNYSQKRRESLISEKLLSINQNLSKQKSRNSLPEDNKNTSLSDVNSKQDDLNLVSGLEFEKQINNNKSAKAINSIGNPSKSRLSNQTNKLGSQNSFNQTYQNGFSKVLQSQNFKHFLNNYIQYNQKLNPTKVTPKQDEKKLDIILDFFDKMQLFKRFFPQNNYDKIIKKNKIINQQNQKLKKIENKQKNTVKPQENDQYQSFYKQYFKPTQASYGISTSNKSKFPTKYF
ncbi:hypothetical protein ABPG72_008784 [Tetrahymena utriculariae]